MIRNFFISNQTDSKKSNEKSHITINRCFMSPLFSCLYVLLISKSVFPLPSKPILDKKEGIQCQKNDDCIDNKLETFSEASSAESPSDEIKCNSQALLKVMIEVSNALFWIFFTIHQIIHRT